jgi:ribonuclease III
MSKLVATAKRLVERELGFCFDNDKLLNQALTHRSVGAVNNERMEFLGDAVLGLVVAESLYGKHETLREGALTRARARVVRRETLASAARELSLGQFLVLGPGELRSGGRDRDSILADALEAVFGAILLDGGIEAARVAVMRALHGPLESINERVIKDPKTRLQEYLQARQLDLPTYEVTSTEGSQHAQTFVVNCETAELSLSTTGHGGSRREAEQAAAEQLLKSLEDGST